MANIAVNLTPLLPGGENGGAKIMIIALITQLAQLAPQHKFLLLTSEKTHDELSYLDAPNIKRWCVHKNKNISRIKKLFFSFKKHTPSFLTSPLFKSYLRKLYYFLLRKKDSALAEKKIDLLFCPFTSPIYRKFGIPTVVVVYDLQYLLYPQFFDSHEIEHRHFVFKEACRWADQMICISNHTRETVLKNSKISAEKVKTIYIQMANRLPIISQEKIQFTLAKKNLIANEFLFYPANFWLHKNHEMLFSAFALYKNKNPEMPLKLVCTGSPDKHMDFLKTVAKNLHLEKDIIFLGYVQEEELYTLMTSCRALIFPSLYEGFGMPILEAMHFNKPILCSNVTSLPEIAKDAAILFDPRKPHAIADAIQQLLQLPDAALKTLITNGQKRVNKFNDSTQMARQYLNILEETLIQHKAGI